MSHRQIGNSPSYHQESVSLGLWRGTVLSLMLVALVGLGLVAALTLGWRTPTPSRSSDYRITPSDWHKHGAGSAQVTQGGYRLRLSGPGQRAWAIPSAEALITNFEAELSVRSLLSSEDAGYGLLYRYQDPKNFYLFAVGGDGYYTIARIQQGILQPLQTWQPWPHVRRGATINRLRVRCQAEVCHFYINDEFTAQVVEDNVIGGELGLWAETFSDPVLEVQFGELRVWRLTRPD